MKSWDLHKNMQSKDFHHILMGNKLYNTGQATQYISVASHLY